MISDADAIVLVSAVAAWEIANKVRAGKGPEAAFLVGDIETAIEEEAFEPLPITLAHARLAGSLPGRTATRSTACSQPRRPWRTRRS